MSELTSCNYCNLKSIKRMAKKKHQKVEVRPSSYDKMEKYSYMGGVDVLVDGEKVAWFMVLPSYCCC